MKTYYIRHTIDLDVDDDTRETIWKKRKIAIHFPLQRTGKLGHADNQSLNLKNHPDDQRRQVRDVKELAKHGGYVCAEYYPQHRCLIGLVKPDTRIQFLKGRWGDRNDRSGLQAILWTLSVTRVATIHRQWQPNITIGRPRRGTISVWHSAGNRIERVVEGVKAKLTLDDLLPCQQETLCSEFLRAPRDTFPEIPKLAHLLLPVGRTLPDIDIYGLATDGKPMFVQVTYREMDDKAAQEKFDTLAEYLNPKANHVIFFCRCKRPFWREGVLVFPIERAFRRFTSTKSGRMWLRAADPAR